MFFTRFNSCPARAGGRKGCPQHSQKKFNNPSTGSCNKRVHVWVCESACAMCEVLSLQSCELCVGGGGQWWQRLYQVYAWSCLGNLTQRSHCHNNYGTLHPPIPPPSRMPPPFSSIQSKLYIIPHSPSLPPSPPSHPLIDITVFSDGKRVVEGDKNNRVKQGWWGELHCKAIKGKDTEKGKQRKHNYKCKYD